MSQDWHSAFSSVRQPESTLANPESNLGLAEARIVIENWRRYYNTIRPHGSLGYKPPAPEVFIPATARAAALPQPAPPPALAQKPPMH
jgi:transposase InsO family protein